jgi:hypothetical protein
VITYDPQKWITTMQRSLRDYLLAEIDTAVSDEAMPFPDDIGLQVFEVLLDYPPSVAPAGDVDFKKTIIHLQIDDIENIKLGFGTDVVAITYTPGDVAHAATIVEKEARCHRVNFDVGVWASDQSGGPSSRLLAMEILEDALGGEMARRKCMSVTQGVEITSFNGGRFVVDTINDVRIFRIIDCTLEVRVYSRKDGESMIVADTISQNPLLTLPA